MSESPTALGFATDVVRRLQDEGHVAVFAGGCVRDMLLARQGRSDPDDYDVATDATPQRVRELFGKRQTLAVGESFGVIIVLGPKVAGRHLQVEVATFRAEGEYSDGRRPDNVVFCTAEEDAARRDFTINGMFYDPVVDEVRDYVDGQRDLERQVVRAIGDPHQRIAEDKLRMMRAVRFTARFGFVLEEATRAAITKHASEINVVSWERITQELSKMLRHHSRSEAVELLRDVGLLRQILPELFADSIPDSSLTATIEKLSALAEPTLPLALASLFRSLPAGDLRRPGTASVSAIGRRLKLSNDDRASLVWLIDRLPSINQFRDLDLADQKEMLAHQDAADLVQLARVDAYARGASTEHVDAAEAYRNNTPHEVLDPPALIDGQDLLDLGMTPGKEFKEILNKVRRAQLNEEITSREAALDCIKRDAP